MKAMVETEIFPALRGDKVHERCPIPLTPPFLLLLGGYVEAVGVAEPPNIYQSLIQTESGNGISNSWNRDPLAAEMDIWN
jgi:hypothetical protein